MAALERSIDEPEYLDVAGWRPTRSGSPANSPCPPEAACRKRPLSGTIMRTEDARGSNSSRTLCENKGGVTNCEQLARTTH